MLLQAKVSKHLLSPPPPACWLSTSLLFLMFEQHFSLLGREKIFFFLALGLLMYFLAHNAVRVFLKGSNVSPPYSPGPIEFPSSIKKIWINIGSHLDPPMPPDDETAVIAVEPVLKTAAGIPSHPHLYIITAAISDTPSFLKISIYNSGMSSSLSVPDNIAAPWSLDNRKGGYPSFSIVPVLTLEMLLASIPDHLSIEWVKTDMQGFDLRAAKSASKSTLRRIKKYQAELYW